MSRKETSDLLLVAITAFGLFYSYVLPAIFITLLVRENIFNLKFGRLLPGHALLALSTFWACIIISYRPLGDSLPLLLQFAFLWLIPFFAFLYKPDENTLKVFSLFIATLFAIDLFFNFYIHITGADPLGRSLDARAGLSVAARGGGLFNHSFYSGTISILAYTFAVTSKSFRWLSVFAIANLLLAGSWRLAIPILLIPFFYWRWNIRSKSSEILQIICFSALFVLLVVITSTESFFGLAENSANALRVFAWLNGIIEIANSPWIGAGYPSARTLETINENVIQESLIAESWYLNSAIVFGVPYAIARFLGIALICYGSKYKNRTPKEAILVPVVFIDFIYGGLMEGALFSIFFWIILAQESKNNY